MDLRKTKKYVMNPNTFWRGVNDKKFIVTLEKDQFALPKYNPVGTFEGVPIDIDYYLPTNIIKEFF